MGIEKYRTCAALLEANMCQFDASVKWQSARYSRCKGHSHGYDNSSYIFLCVSCLSILQYQIFFIFSIRIMTVTNCRFYITI